MNKFTAILALLAMVFTLGCGTGCVATNQFQVEGDERPDHFQTKSFVKITVSLKKDGRGVMGSGSVIATYRDNSFVLTAAHVCMPDPIIRAHLLTDKPIISKVITPEGKKYFAVPIKVDKKNDLCIMHAKGFEGQALPLAQEYPKLGDKYFNMAAPQGIFGGGVVPIFDGYFSGNYDSKYSEQSFDIYSIPVKGGSSGSPIFNKNQEVVGVVSRKFRGFDHLTISVKYAKVYNFVYTFKELLKEKTS